MSPTRNDPVWAWPDPEGDPARPTVESAVTERLFQCAFGRAEAAVSRRERAEVVKFTILR